MWITKPLLLLASFTVLVASSPFPNPEADISVKLEKYDAEPFNLKIPEPGRFAKKDRKGDVLRVPEPGRFAKKDRKGDVLRVPEPGRFAKKDNY